MSPALRVQLAGLLFTLILPAAAAALVALLGRRLTLRPSGRDGGQQAPPPRSVVTGLAVMAGVAAAYLGVAGLAGNAAHRWVLFGALTAGAAGLALDAVVSRRGATEGAIPRALVFALALGTLALFGWASLAPLAGYWDSAPVAARLATEAWAIDALVLGLGVWLLADHAAREATTPVTLAPFALAFAAAGGGIVLAGSALVGQLAGALGVAVAVVGLLALRFRDLNAGRGAVAAASAALLLLLAHAHFFVGLGRPIATLLAVVPVAALAGAAVLRRRPEARWRALALTLALGAIPAGTALWLARAADLAETESTDSEGGGPSRDYGGLGGY